MKKNYTINIPVFKFWFLFVPLFILCLLAGGIVGVMVIDRFVMPNVVGIKNKNTVSVPDIRDMPYKEARDELYKSNLRLKIVHEQYNADLPENVIISQIPEPGEEIKKSRYIGVVLSRGAEVDTVPDTRFMTDNKVGRVLRAEGFSNIKIYRKYDDKCPKNQVVKTEPAAGMLVSREIPVKVYISDGPKPESVPVPNVIGDMLSEAKEKIQSGDLKVGKIEYEVHSSSPGRVLLQSEPPGSSVPVESSINLTVSSKK